MILDWTHLAPLANGRYGLMSGNELTSTPGAPDADSKVPDPEWRWRAALTYRSFSAMAMGRFQPSAVYALPSGTYVAGLITSDFNGDGILDLAVTNCASYCEGSYLSILLGNGDGTFQPPVSSSEALTGCLAAGDFNGNGKVDLALCGPNNEILIQLGIGNGSFAPPVSYPVTGDSGVVVQLVLRQHAELGPCL